MNEDILNYIFGFLNHKDIINCIMVNKLFCKLCFANTLWKKMFLRDFKGVGLFKKNHYITYNKCYDLTMFKKKTNYDDTIDNLNFTTEMHLEQYHMTRTLLYKIPLELCKLVRLKKLFLVGNRLETLPVEINNLINLKVLDVSFNYLDQICPLTNLKNLKKINLIVNRLKVFPELCSLKLKTIEIYQNLIELLPDTIGQFTNLGRLDISSNKIPNFPSSITNLKKLKYMDAKHNAITSMMDMCELPNLRYLHLDNNKIDTIPPTISNLTCLTSLALRNNVLNHIPDEIGTLTQLKKLDVMNNNITHIPISILKSPNITIIMTNFTYNS